MHPEIIEIIKDSNEILEPETLRNVHTEYSEREINRILAFATLYKTEAFFENFYLFENIVHGLSGRIPEFMQIEGCSPAELWNGLEIAHQLFPDHEFAKEVLLYIQYFMNLSGVYIYPPWLDIPNPYYSKAVYMSEHGPFPLTDNTIEEIQAAKFLCIQEDIKKLQNQK